MNPGAVPNESDFHVDVENAIQQSLVQSAGGSLHETIVIHPRLQVIGCHLSMRIHSMVHILG